MGHRSWQWILVLGLTACGLGGGDDDDDDDDYDLTPLEWSMVGVWRGERPDERWYYYVLNEDRTGCAWTREGDDFSRRFDEIQFRDWTVDADALDEDLHMPLDFQIISNGEVFDHDRYDVDNDRILAGGHTNLPHYWRSIRIDCAATGTEATETDVQRWGSLGNGYVGEGDPNGTFGTSLTGPGPGSTGAHTSPGPGTSGTTTPGTHSSGTTPTGPATTTDTGTVVYTDPGTGTDTADTADTAVDTGTTGTGPIPP